MDPVRNNYCIYDMMLTETNALYVGKVVYFFWIGLLRCREVKQ